MTIIMKMMVRESNYNRKDGEISWTGFHLIFKKWCQAWDRVVEYNHWLQCTAVVIINEDDGDRLGQDHVGWWWRLCRKGGKSDKKKFCWRQWWQYLPAWQSRNKDFSQLGQFNQPRVIERLQALGNLVSGMLPQNGAIKRIRWAIKVKLEV